MNLEGTSLKSELKKRLEPGTNLTEYTNFRNKLVIEFGNEAVNEAERLAKEEFNEEQSRRSQRDGADSGKTGTLFFPNR